MLEKTEGSGGRRQQKMRLLDDITDSMEFEQTMGDGEGQESLVCCSPWGCKESDTTERLNNKIVSLIWADKKNLVNTRAIDIINSN